MSATRANLDDLFAERVLPPPAPRARERVWVQVLLLLLTFASTTLAGGCHYLGFEQAFEQMPAMGAQESRDWLSGLFSRPAFYLNGLWYSLTVLGILGCHEMGHYVACLRYGVDATRPYFLPAPLLTGTLGAFIRIRSRIPSKAALFDIGIAGPIAGFVVAVPALFAGLALSEVVELPADQTELVSLGEPLLFRFAAWLIFGDVPDGYSINMHPMAFASWFGLLATALNLFPVAQLDGGHISYAVMGRRSIWVTLAMVLVAVGLASFSPSWIAWTVMILLMLVIVGPRHPPTLDDRTPLDAARLGLSLVALVMLIVCFTPVPIEPFVTGGG
ncbi:MAG: site-2 protease family protein [Acidobacteria bacterium]|nr:site-2 protease family protein [Acidobacteriota bacterium]